MQKEEPWSLNFYNGDWWVSLTKQAGQFFVPKTLRDRFGGVNAMKNFLGIATHPALERSFKAASKLKNELPIDLKMESIPLEELLSLVENIHIKTREASQNTTSTCESSLGSTRLYKSYGGELLIIPEN